MISNDCAKLICYESCSDMELAGLKLPLDAVALIFSQLNVKNLQKTRLVDRSWFCASSSYIQKYTSILLKQLVQFTYDSLKKDTIEGQMQEILAEVNAWEIKQETLLEISECLLKVRDKLVYILTNLEPHIIRKLEHSSKELRKPIFFDKLFAIACIMSELEHSKLDEDMIASHFDKEKAGKVGIAAVALTFLGCSNKAIRLVDTTPHILTKSSCWNYGGSNSVKFANFRIQIQQNCSLRRFDKVVEIAKSVKYQDSKFITFETAEDVSNSIQMICEELVKAKKTRKAYEILECIRNRHWKQQLENVMKCVDSSEPLTDDQINRIQLKLQSECMAVSINRFHRG